MWSTSYQVYKQSLLFKTVEVVSEHLLECVCIAMSIMYQFFCVCVQGQVYEEDGPRQGVSCQTQ